MRALVKLCLAAVALGALVPGAHAATITVNTTADVLADDGICSLREAVFAARYNQALQGCAAGAGDDVIQLEAGEYRLAAGGPGEDGNETGDLDTGPGSVLRIVGRGMGATLVGGVGDRTFDVAPSATLGLTDLTIRDSIAPPGASGGAVRNRGVLTVFRVGFVNTAAGNSVRPQVGAGPQAAGSGGAIYSSGSRLEIADSFFSATRAGDGVNSEAIVDGGVTNAYGATSGSPGGAVHIDGGTASLSGVTVTGARAGHGGSGGAGSFPFGANGGDGGAVAITEGSAQIVNSTFQGNRAGNAGSPRTYQQSVLEPGDGGAIYAAAPATAAVTFSTFSGNAVGAGADASTGVGASIAGASAGASILADAGNACATAVSGGLANVVLPGDISCPGSRIAGDPRLGALVANGGPTPTMVPGAGSVATNALAGVPCPGTDQRGLARPQLGACDAGAVEIQPGIPEAIGAPGAPGAPGAGVGGGAARTLGPGATTARRITGVTLSRGSFRTYGRAKGTILSVRLDIASSLALSVTKPAQGRRSKGRCVKPTGTLLGKPRCTRQVPLPGKITKAGRAGLNPITFTGRIGGRTLAPGSYTFVVTLPKDGSAAPVVARKGFRVLP